MSSETNLKQICFISVLFQFYFCFISVVRAVLTSGCKQQVVWIFGVGQKLNFTTTGRRNAFSCKSCFTMRWTDRRDIPLSREISHGDLLEPGWPSWLQMSSSTTTMLSDVRTDRGRPVPLFLSALPVSSTLLIKAFKVLRFPLSRGKFSHHSKRCPSFFQLATHEIMLYRHLLTDAFYF